MTYQHFPESYFSLGIFEMKRNHVLEDRIRHYVNEHPGLVRRQIARGLQKAGVNLGQQHISNRTGELIALGYLQERISDDGQRLVFPVTSKGVNA